MSFLLGSWGMNQSAGQTNRLNHEEVLGGLFIPHSYSFPINIKIRPLFLILPNLLELGVCFAHASFCNRTVDLNHTHHGVM